MRHGDIPSHHSQKPLLLDKADKLARYLMTLSPDQIMQSMKVSTPMALRTQQLLQAWSTDPSLQRPAIDAFLGDIYSGLQVSRFSPADREYANEHLYILSGLYGILRALDDIMPYRLEMGYRLPDQPYASLYSFWGNALASVLPAEEPIINLTAVEYTKALLPYLKKRSVISPKFMTTHPDTGQPVFVTVHAKIARGAFAHWLIVNRVSDLEQLKDFTDLGYSYAESLSTATIPVFVCDHFEGIGLSVRLT